MNMSFYALRLACYSIYSKICQEAYGLVGDLWFAPIFTVPTNNMTTIRIFRGLNGLNGAKKESITAQLLKPGDSVNMPGDGDAECRTSDVDGGFLRIQSR